MTMCNINPLDVHFKAMELRKRIRNNQGADEAKRELEILSEPNAGRCRLQPKTPMEAPHCLYYFSDYETPAAEEPELKEKICVKSIENFQAGSIYEDIVGEKSIFSFVKMESTPWTEDYLHIYVDGTVGTMLTFYNNEDVIRVITEGQKSRLGEENPLYKVLTASYTCTQNVYLPEKHAGHYFMRSIIEGGNMLTGSDFALIGKDSLYVTCVQNGMTEEEARALIALETGYDADKLYFVEQPGTYHLDLNMLLLGKGENGIERVLVNKEYKGVSLQCIHEELRGYGFEVIVDEAGVGGSVQGTVPAVRDNDAVNVNSDHGSRSTDLCWRYNFYNGEFVYGKDNKLYYVTNGITPGSNMSVNDIQGIQEAFENFLKQYVPTVQKVIYCKKMTVALLNHTHGGVGCRFKGGPDELLFV